MEKPGQALLLLTRNPMEDSCSEEHRDEGSLFIRRPKAPTLSEGLSPRWDGLQYVSVSPRSTPGGKRAKCQPGYLEKYPVLARTFTPSRFGFITIFRNVSSFNGSVG
jgi:hypothetical protein